DFREHGFQKGPGIALHHHLEADELIVLEEFDKGKNQQRDVRHLAKDGGPVSQARKSPEDKEKVAV
ncbi:hypothetical protein E2320_011667, partial [Naja naja]